MIPNTAPVITVSQWLISSKLVVFSLLHHLPENSGKLSSGFWKWSILFSCSLWSPHGGHTFQTWASLSQPKPLICELFVQMGMKKNLPSFPPIPSEPVLLRQLLAAFLFCLVKCVQQMHRAEVWEGSSQPRAPWTNSSSYCQISLHQRTVASRKYWGPQTSRARWDWSKGLPNLYWIFI